MFTFGLFTTSGGKLFQGMITRCEKKFLLVSVLGSFPLQSFMSWLLVHCKLFVPVVLRIGALSRSVSLFRILYTVIISPRVRLSLSLKRFSFWSRSSYSKFYNPATILVARRWTFSISIISFS